MDPEFKKVFEESIKRQMQQNEAHRQELDDFLGGLRANTERMMSQGSFQMPAVSPPQPIPQESQSLNVVSQDWVKTVIQAASLDLAFLLETGARASQIVTLAIQQPPATPGAPADVPPGQDSS